MSDLPASILPSNSLENKGVLFSFGFDAQGSLTDTALSVHWTWKILALTDARARRAIGKEEVVPIEIRDELASAGSHYHLDFDDGWLHGCIPDLLHEHYNDSGKLGHLHLALSEKSLIIARRQPLQSLDDIRLMVERQKTKWPTPLSLIDGLVAKLSDTISQKLAELSVQLDSIEDRIVREAWQSERERLSLVRRQAVLLNRHVSTISAVFRTLEHARHRDLPREISELLRDFIQRGISLHHDVEQIQARARLLQEEIMAKLSERSNSLLSFISIMTAVMLPATVITGLFGMNTSGLPFSDSQYGFWFVTMLAVTLVSLCLATVKRLFR